MLMVDFYLGRWGAGEGGALNKKKEPTSLLYTLLLLWTSWGDRMSSTGRWSPRTKLSMMVHFYECVCVCVCVCVLGEGVYNFFKLLFMMIEDLYGGEETPVFCFVCYAPPSCYAPPPPPPVSLSVSVSVSLSVSLSVCLSVCLSDCLSVGHWRPNPLSQNCVCVHPLVARGRTGSRHVHEPKSEKQIDTAAPGSGPWYLWWACDPSKDCCRLGSW